MLTDSLSAYRIVRTTRLARTAARRGRREPGRRRCFRDDRFGRSRQRRARRARCADSSATSSPRLVGEPFARAATSTASRMNWCARGSWPRAKPYARTHARSTVDIREYAATALLAVASDHQTLCARIGDGGIVLRRTPAMPSRWRCGPIAENTPTKPISSPTTRPPSGSRSRVSTTCPMSSPFHGRAADISRSSMQRARRFRRFSFRWWRPCAARATPTANCGRGAHRLSQLAGDQRADRRRQGAGCGLPDFCRRAKTLRIDDGAVVSLGKKLGAGGEGAVFRINESPPASRRSIPNRSSRAKSPNSKPWSP